MQEESHSTSPYPYDIDSVTKRYFFRTYSGREYSAFFSEASNYFPEYSERFHGHVKMCAFDNDLSKKPDRKKIVTGEGETKWEAIGDPRVSATIQKIFKDYLEERPYVCIVFVCSQEGEMEQLRQRLFRRWFNCTQSNPNLRTSMEITWHERSILVDKNDTKSSYTTLLALHSCPYKSEIEQAYFDYEDSLRAKGY